DVKVIVNAGATDNRSADRFTIVLKNDYSQFQAEEAVFLPAPRITLDGDQDLYGGSADPYNVLRLASSAPLTAPTEVGRLRYTLYPGRTGNSYDPYNSTIQVVEQQYDPAGNIPTSLTNHAGPFQNIYAAPVPFIYDSAHPENMGSPVGEFDQNVRVRSLAPATLQIETRLQGRRASDGPERFIQPMRVELRTHNAGPAVRTLTSPMYQWNFTPSDPATGAATTTFSFGTLSSQVSGTTNGRLASGTFAPGANAPSTVNPLPVNGIEPGTYDVYVKGQSSVGVLIENVEFGAGAAREIRGLVLREGDLDTSPGQVDRININDFAQLSGSYGTSTFSAVNPRADMNQSGYIDVLDFSLLASNYGTATSTFVPNIPVTMTVVDGDGGPLGASLTMLSSASRTFTVKLDSGQNTVQGATVRVSSGGGSGTGGYAGSAFNVCGTSQDSCGYGSQEYVVHWETPASQTFTVGTFTIYGRQCETMADTPCEGDLVVSLVDAQGVDASGHRATFSAPVQVREVDVLPPLPVALRLTGP
ncbi:MAG: hypothetical protein EB020_13625, partial [Proteobacteria bacterium]|nr:hypothetical protein [Pseudomonadota bacterium]